MVEDGTSLRDARHARIEMVTKRALEGNSVHFNEIGLLLAARLFLQTVTLDERKRQCIWFWQRKNVALLFFYHSVAIFPGQNVREKSSVNGWYNSFTLF